MTDSSPRFHFRASQRLHGRRAFAAVFGARMRKVVGPLIVYGKRNDLPHNRLGLSVSRRVGSAVTRNRIKRLIREAFRLSQHELPTGYDLVVAVRPHKTAELSDYQRMLQTAVAALHHQWRRRSKMSSTDDTDKQG